LAIIYGMVEKQTVKQVVIGPITSTPSIIGMTDLNG
jgi:hypothetical protein